MPSFESTDLLLIYPEIMLVVGAVIFLLLGAFLGNRATSVIMFGAIGLLVAIAFGLLPEQLDPSYGFGALIRVDSFTQFAKFMTVISAILVLIISFDWVGHESHRRFEYPVLILLSLAGMMILISANDLLTVYMGLELSSLALYVLASMDRDDARSCEAGLKYFILGALASGMMLFGASLVYGFAGSTNFTALSNLFVNGGETGTAVSAGLIVGLIMLMVGFCFKISAVPFHMWTPDVYEGAPTPVTAFFATAPKIAALMMFIRLLFQPFGDLAPDWQMIIEVAAIGSMLVGALGAMVQTSLKRLLAYSSIGHIGYNLVGLATADVEGAKGALIYLSLYIFMSIGTFAYLLLMKRDGKQVEGLSDLSGLARTCPIAALFMAIMMFSMAGIPPFSGFYGKWFVFYSAVEANMFALAIMGVLTSALAAYYYLKIVKIMYFDAPTEHPLDKNAPLHMQAVMVLCAVVTAGYFIVPTSLVKSAEIAAKALIAS